MSKRRLASTPAPSSGAATTELPIDLDLEPHALARALRARDGSVLWLDGGHRGVDGWACGRLLAVAPRPCWSLDGAPRDGASAALAQLDRLLEARRRTAGSAATGLAVLVGYGLLDESAGGARDDDGLPSLVAVEVDRSIHWTDEGARFTVRHDGRGDASEVGARRTVDEELAGLAREARAAPPPGPPRLVTAPRTSLPRDSYLEAVRAARSHIARGDIYQANLCQRFAARWEGDALELHRRAVGASPAPMSAFLALPGLTVCSASPEVFLRLRPPDRIETFPIKGTRPRGATPAEDRALAGELVASAKDRAELLMIVDLERNDLGRVCRTGSVETHEIAALRSFARVHHLVGHVSGRLRPGVGAAELLAATFPGGSISGAPKLRAMEILRGLEPVRRNFFTGSLLWFGDDGSLDSSLLIRTWVLSGQRAWLGAGGGIVADSDPEGEWIESNLKARALTRALGFEPEEAR